MASVIPASPNQWLPIVQAQLQTLTGLPTERVNVAVRSDMPMPHTQDLLVIPKDIVGQQAYLLGMGRVSPSVVQHLCVVVRTRLATDNPETDLQLLTDPILGQIQLEILVLGLIDFQPTDKSGNALLVTPLHFVSGPELDKASPQVDTVSRVLTFEAEYVLPLPGVTQANL